MIAIPVKCAVILFDISVCGIQTVAVCLAKSLKLDIVVRASRAANGILQQSLETNINISVVYIETEFS